MITNEYNSKQEVNKMELSGTRVRDLILKNKNIPDYLINPIAANVLIELHNDKNQKLFVD